jgi:predicted phage terminase large subunit-like protein
MAKIFLPQLSMSTYPTMTDIRPQPRQETFLASSADIAIFGGGAGGGKTWALLLEPLRNVSNKDFGAVIFRRTIPEITHEGALWDEAKRIYPLLNATANENDKQFRFPSGSKVTFSHMQREDDKLAWKSAQIPLIEFDQLEMFSSSQFFYMLSRNRSMCGVRPYVRSSANPEPGWLADFLAWWISDDGYAIPERSGVLRWLVRENDVNYWDDDPEALQAAHPTSTPKSVTFILSTVYDNQILLDADPGYLANLQALDNIERQRLLGDGKRGGNWKIKPAAGKLFNKSWFEIVDAVPAGGQELRFWDLAATEKKTADYTASNKQKIVNGIVYIIDATADQIDPARTDTTMLNTAKQDGKFVSIRFEREGGASGKRDASHIVTMLAGYDVQGVAPETDKVTRAKPLAAQALAGNVKLLRGSWNERWLNHMHGQPDLDHDDEMDAASGSYNELVAPSSSWDDTHELGRVDDYNPLGR